jgi:hypothetical protein
MGTAGVLVALRDLGRIDSGEAQRALAWLVAAQQADGSWGDAAARDAAKPERRGGVEETALATEALLSCGQSTSQEAAALKGIAWLVDAVEVNRHQEAAPVGLWLGGVGYCGRARPMAITVSALGQAARRLLPAGAARAVAHTAKIGS